MKASFLAAGFDESRCVYEVFDNSEANTHDPYRTINAVMEAATEPYIIFCHQDVLANKGDGFDKLLAGLDSLTQKDANWAIAGNTGYSDNLTLVRKIDDPYEIANCNHLPKRVYTLDENFFVLRTAAGLRCSEGLTGFHLYATDLCLQATQRRLSCYVIDFYLTHLSAGDAQGNDFNLALDRFVQNWNPYFTLCLIHTPCVFIRLSRNRVIRLLLWARTRIPGLRVVMWTYLRIAHVKRLVSL